MWFIPALHKFPEFCRMIDVEYDWPTNRNYHFHYPRFRMQKALFVCCMWQQFHHRSRCGTCVNCLRALVCCGNWQLCWYNTLNVWIIKVHSEEHVLKMNPRQCWRDIFLSEFKLFCRHRFHLRKHVNFLCILSSITRNSSCVNYTHLK